jgi:hypothetical protein
MTHETKKRATIIINEGTQRRSSKKRAEQGRDDGWYGFRAQGIHNNGERKKELVLASTEREIGLYGTLLQMSRRYFRHSWYFWDAGCTAWPLGFPLRLACGWRGWKQGIESSSQE